MEMLTANATTPPLDPLQNNVVDEITVNRRNIGRILTPLGCVDK
jgi:hypothetical protein